MDINQIRETMTAEINSIEQTIEQRAAQIIELTEANGASKARIEALRTAMASITETINQLNAIGPLDSKTSTALAAPVRRSRTKLRLILPPILQGAGLVGITAEEIIAHHKNNTGEEIQKSSLNSFLYRGVKDKKYERLNNGCWRIPQQQPQPVPTPVAPGLPFGPDAFSARR